MNIVTDAVVGIFVAFALAIIIRSWLKAQPRKQDERERKTGRLWGRRED